MLPPKDGLPGGNTETRKKDAGYESLHMKKHHTDEKRAANPRHQDPLTERSAVSPEAVGAGALIGGMAATVLGAPAMGPGGAMAGGSMVGGALAGGILGRTTTGEGIDPSVEDAYWRERHSLEAYGAGTEYEDFEPAYRAGYEGYARYGGKRFDDVEADIARDYSSHRAGLPWDKARPAARAAWSRVHDRMVTHRSPEEGENAGA